MSIRGNLFSFLAVLACAALASVITTLVVLGSPGYAVVRAIPDPRLEPVLQHVAVDTQGNVIIQGVNVMIKAQNNSNLQSGGNSRIAAGSNLTVTGGTNATLQAGATAIVKGALVKIN